MNDEGLCPGTGEGTPDTRDPSESPGEMTSVRLTRRWTSSHGILREGNQSEIGIEPFLGRNEGRDGPSRVSRPEKTFFYE